MPALLTRMSRRPNFSAAPLTKPTHAASVATSACVKATLAPAAASSAATRWPRSPSRSQNATLAPSATKRLTVASPIPDAPPVTAAILPSSLPMFPHLSALVVTPASLQRLQVTDDPGHHPVGNRFLSAHPVVAVGVALDLFQRLTGLTGDDAVDALAHLDDLDRLDVDVG